MIFCLKLVGTPLRRWKFFVFQSHFYLYLRERKDAFKAFQKTKYFTLCECKCTVIFNRKKGPPKLNGNLRNNMQSGSKHSRKQEFRHERDREEGEFGSEKRLKRSGDHNEGSNPRKRRRSRSPPPPRRSRGSPRRSPWVPLRKSKASRNNNKYWEIWKNISMWKIRIPTIVSLSSEMAFSVLFSLWLCTTTSDCHHTLVVFLALMLLLFTSKMPQFSMLETVPCPSRVSWIMWIHPFGNFCIHQRSVNMTGYELVTINHDCVSGSSPASRIFHIFVDLW